MGSGVALASSAGQGDRQGGRLPPPKGPVSQGASREEGSSCLCEPGPLITASPPQVWTRAISVAVWASAGLRRVWAPFSYAICQRQPRAHRSPRQCHLTSLSGRKRADRGPVPLLSPGSGAPIVVKSPLNPQFGQLNGEERGGQWRAKVQFLWGEGPGGRALWKSMSPVLFKKNPHTKASPCSETYSNSLAGK